MERANALRRAVILATACAVTPRVAQLDDGRTRITMRPTPGLYGRPMGPAELDARARYNRRARQTHPRKRGRR